MKRKPTRAKGAASKAALLTRDAAAPRIARTAPEGFAPATIHNRFLQVAPSSYNADAHTVEVVLSVGARRAFFGILEELAISPEAIDLSRVELGQVPILDTHNQYELDAVLGRLEKAWIVNGQLMGLVRFGETERAKAIEGMVARGEIKGISIGYRVTTWTIVGVENDMEIWQAARWELLEASFVSVPADPQATVRSVSSPQPSLQQPLSHFSVRARMRMRQAEA